jgi:hypothetical protein
MKITAMQEAEMGGLWSFKVRQKLTRSPSQPKGWLWWLTSIILARWEVEVRGLRHEAGPLQRRMNLSKKD